MFTRKIIALTTATAMTATIAVPAFADDIVETAMSAPQFSTLVAAVTAADLASVLQGDGPFTVLAPNDAAFAKLPEGTLEELLKPENKDQLVEILSYHVMEGELAATLLRRDAATDDDTGTIGFPTLQGQSMVFFNDTLNTTIGTDDDYGPMFVSVDIAADNGVIHEIDTVLMPSN